MADENLYAVILTEQEMRMALETVNKAAYVGSVSDVVSSLREKLNPDAQEPIKEEKQKVRTKTRKQ